MWTQSRRERSCFRTEPTTSWLQSPAAVIPTAGANAVTRWREDVTRDNWGTFIYLRDVRSGAVWSAGYQPVRKRPQSYEVAFSEDKADFWRTDAGIRTHMEIVVSAEDNAEVRRISLTNTSTRTREIELTQLRGSGSQSRHRLTQPIRRSATSSSKRNSSRRKTRFWRTAASGQARTSPSGAFTSLWSRVIS